MGKSVYQKKLKDYVSVYAVSYQTIKQWAAKGYPLDDTNAVAEIRAGLRPVPTGTPAPAPTQQLSPASGLGMAAATQRLRQAELQAHEAWLNADDNTRNARRVEWEGLYEALRKAEKDSPEIAAANKEAVRISEVSLELAGLFRNLRSDLDSLGKRLATKLVGKDALDIKQTIDAETALIVAGLFDAKYLREVGNRE